MIRYEHFKTDIDAFCRRVELPDTLYSEFMAVGAKTGIRPTSATPKEMFAGFSEGVRIITELFDEEIQAYGYEAP